MKKLHVVVLGGGTGQATLLRGLKNLDHIKLTAIVTVADDGGSTGRLRRQFHIPAMGDIRNVMVALAESETLLSKLMSYRFQNHPDSEISGHNLGNLMLTALTESSGNFMEAIASISKVLNVKGRIVPSSLQVITLYAQMVDGTIVRGETNIPNMNNRISRVYYEEEVVASRQAVEAIQQADVILYGIGSLYTSICPNLIIKDIQNAIIASKAKKVYVCNAMSQPGETDGYDMNDHVQAIVKHSQCQVDTVIFAEDNLPDDVLLRYKKMKSHPIICTNRKYSYEVIKKSMLDFSDGLVRHDPLKVQQVFEELLHKG